MSRRERPYLFYDALISICSTCYRKVEGKIIFQDGGVYMTKRCPTHGWEKVLVADDIEYYKRSRERFLRPPEQPARTNTPIKYGCPYDCGLCPDHEQHSCLTVLEICDACNLECPICYANSGPARQSYRSVEQVVSMLDAIVANELEPDVVQISGGEPTLHPDFFEILDEARARPIRHLMLNTNGLRIAQDEAFAERLAEVGRGFEIYLQFDSFEREALMALRGADLRRVREQAIERCNALGLSVTLVVTLKKGLNDREMGRIIDHGLSQPCVRGVTFQPIQAAGRLEGYDPARDRLTLTEVRRGILDQAPIFSDEDLVPVPCHPDSLAMAFALKLNGEVHPLTRYLPVETLLEGRNTVVMDTEGPIGEHFSKLFSTGSSPQQQATTLSELLCCLPRVPVPETLGYANLFRVMIMAFIDAHDFDLRSVKKTCVHIVHPDGRLIPFDTYNLFYRDGLEETRLGPIRARIEAQG